MKKHMILFVVLVVLSLSLSACDADSSAGVTEAEATSEETSASPLPVGSSGKIAVIRNLGSSDHTAQFFAGAVSEGEALGYEVNTFMSEADDVKMQDLMEAALQQDYDIWVVSHANEGYQYDIVSKAVEKNVSVVCFDCGGDHVPGVSYTSQNDQALASISIDALIEKAKTEGATEPVKIIELNTLGAIVPFDTRHTIIEEYISEGKLERVNLLSPTIFGSDMYSDVYNGITTTLAQDPDKEIKGLWTASSYFMDPISDAIRDSEREDIIVTAVDISTTEIQRLVSDPFYYAIAAVDPFVIGVVDVRLGVLQSMGIDTPETVALDAVVVTDKDVTADDTMLTLADKFEGFGSTDLFDTQELKDLKSKVAGD
jgi:simple sugar transport system substrate-binding protein